MIILRNVDAIDRSNEEKEKAGRHESSDSDDLRPCRKAKRTAKIGILKSLTETASDNNGSDFDEDYSVTGAGTKRKPPSKIQGKVLRNQWKVRSVQFVLRSVSTVGF